MNFKTRSKSIALFNLNRHKEFKEAIMHTLKLNPNDTQMCNLLAEYYLMYGDIVNASNYVDNALLIDKDNAISLYIMGKIKIEEQNYITSITCFKKAISLDLRNPIYLLWDSYAKHLMTELELASDEKKYQDSMLGIIRELRKTNNCDYIKDKNHKVTSYWFFKVIPDKFKNLAISALIYTKQKIIYSNMNEKNIVKLLEIICTIVDDFKNKRNMAYNYYFLGCFYYKINDYFTAIDCLKQCNKLSPDHEISELVDNIWNTKIKPSFLKWWLYSPSHRWFKRISFVTLVSFLFGILLPSVASNILVFVYNLAFKPIFAYQPVADFLVIKSIASIFIFSLVSFFSSVNWVENTTQLTLLTVSIIFILTSPGIQHFKSSQIEIEVHPPPAFEFTPSLIEKKLDDLDNIIKL